MEKGARLIGHVRYESGKKTLQMEVLLWRCKEERWEESQPNLKVYKKNAINLLIKILIENIYLNVKKDK